MGFQVHPFPVLIPISNLQLSTTLLGDEPHKVLVDAVARMKGAKHHPNSIGVQIVQIGDEEDAIQALKDLMHGDVGVRVALIFRGVTLNIVLVEHGRYCTAQRDINPRQAGKNSPRWPPSYYSCHASSFSLNLLMFVYTRRSR